VGDNDPLEVPCKNALKARPRRASIANEQRIERGGTEAPVTPKQLHEQASRSGGTRPEVEREISQNESTTRLMKEDHLILVRAPAEENLIYLSSPLLLRR